MRARTWPASTRPTSVAARTASIARPTSASKRSTAKARSRRAPRRGREKKAAGQPRRCPSGAACVAAIDLLHSLVSRGGRRCPNLAARHRPAMSRVCARRVGHVSRICDESVPRDGPARGISGWVDSSTWTSQAPVSGEQTPDVSPLGAVSDQTTTRSRSTRAAAARFRLRMVRMVVSSMPPA
jgi:hypothetical protein